MPAPAADDLNVPDAPSKPTPAPAPAPSKSAKPAPAAKDEPKTEAPAKDAPARYRVLGHCARRFKPGDVATAEDFRPVAKFETPEEAEAATDAAIERLLKLGVIAPE